ncbi:MAG: hypothetical protein ACK559_15655, partial [bacterium]
MASSQSPSEIRKPSPSSSTGPGAESSSPPPPFGFETDSQPTSARNAWPEAGSAQRTTPPVEAGTAPASAVAGTPSRRNGSMVGPR